MSSFLVDGPLSLLDLLLLLFSRFLELLLISGLAVDLDAPNLFSVLGGDFLLTETDDFSLVLVLRTGFKSLTRFESILPPLTPPLLEQEILSLICLVSAEPSNFLIEIVKFFTGTDPLELRRDILRGGCRIISEIISISSLAISPSSNSLSLVTGSVNFSIVPAFTAASRMVIRKMKLFTIL